MVTIKFLGGRKVKRKKRKKCMGIKSCLYCLFSYTPDQILPVSYLHNPELQMISWSEVWGVYCTAWPGTDRRLYQLWSWWWPEIKGGEGVLRYSSNLYPSCCLQQNKIKWSLPRGEVRGWIYYERNYKASLTDESELTMTSNISVFNEIHFGRIREINKYLCGTETCQTLYR